MKVIENHRSKTINEKIETGMAPKTNLVTDDYSSYKKIIPVVEHTAHKEDKANVANVLPWVHKAINNAKRLLLDVYRRNDDDFLQNYLKEFCYKFNRRDFGSGTMEGLLIAAVNYR